MLSAPFQFSIVQWGHDSLSAKQITELWQRAHPSFPRTQMAIEHEMKMRTQNDPFWQISVWNNEQLIGMAEAAVPAYESHDGWLTSFVLLDQHYARTSLATELLQQVEQQAKMLGAKILTTKLHDDWWELAFYKDHGYYEIDHTLISELDLTQFDLAIYQQSLEKMKAAGVTLKSLAEFGDFDEALQRQLYNLFFIVLSDIPANPPLVVWSFEYWQQHSAAQMKHREGVWVAVAPNGDLIGLAEVHRSFEKNGCKALHNGLTGVHPAWRGRGIAKALKAAAYNSAIKHDYQFIRTVNHQHNKVILGINYQLGFIKQIGRALMVKEV